MLIKEMTSLIKEMGLSVREMVDFGFEKALKISRATRVGLSSEGSGLQNHKVNSQTDGDCLLRLMVGKRPNGRL